MSTGDYQFTPQPGDILLLERPPSGHNPDISKLIRDATHSPYSHILVALGDDQYAEATSGDNGRSDINCLDARQLDERVNQVVRVDLFRGSDPPVDRQRLVEAVSEFANRARPGQPAQVRFSLGSAACLAMLQRVQRQIRDDSLGQTQGEHGSTPVPEGSWTDQGLVHLDLERLQRALFWALENGDSQLFCSEFAHVVLNQAGRRTRLPQKPALDTGGYPTDEPIAVLGIRDHILRIAQSLSRTVLHDENAIETIFAEAVRVIGAYLLKLSPARLTIATYFTPADFSRSPTYGRIAQRRKECGAEWFEMPPMPPDGTWP